MEYCDINLEQYVEGAGRVPIPDWKNAGAAERIPYVINKVMTDVPEGLAFIHTCDEIHRDVSTQNSMH